MQSHLEWPAKLSKELKWFVAYCGQNYLKWYSRLNGEQPHVPDQQSFSLPLLIESPNSFRPKKS